MLKLDETYDAGSAHEFFISYEAGRPGGSIDRARLHYRRALELSNGARVTAHLALAEAVSIKQQNLAEFRALLDKVLSADAGAASKFRLVNALAQDRAFWLKARIPDLFLDGDSTGAS